MYKRQGVSRAGEVLFAPLREHFKVYAFKSCRETPIVPAILGNDAGIYGSVRPVSYTHLDVYKRQF